MEVFKYYISRFSSIHINFRAHENSHGALEIQGSKILEHPWEISYSIGNLWGISFPKGSQISDGVLDFLNPMDFPMGGAYLPLKKRCQGMVIKAK